MREESIQVTIKTRGQDHSGEVGQRRQSNRIHLPHEGLKYLLSPKRIMTVKSIKMKRFLQEGKKKSVLLFQEEEMLKKRKRIFQQNVDLHAFRVGIKYTKRGGCEFRKDKPCLMKMTTQPLACESLEESQ